MNNNFFIPISTSILLGISLIILIYLYSKYIRVKKDIRYQLSNIEVKSMLGHISSAINVNTDEDGDVVFKYKDKDGDLIHVVITCSKPQELTATTYIMLSDDYFLASTLATNHWNQQSSDTYSFSTSYQNKIIIFLNSSLFLKGGITSLNAKKWLENFISQINQFEESILSDVNSLGNDSKLTKEKSAFLTALENVATNQLAESVWDVIKYLLS